MFDIIKPILQLRSQTETIKLISSRIGEIVCTNCCSFYPPICKFCWFYQILIFQKKNFNFSTFYKTGRKLKTHHQSFPTFSKSKSSSFLIGYEYLRFLWISKLLKTTTCSFCILFVQLASQFNASIYLRSFFYKTRQESKTNHQSFCTLKSSRFLTGYEYLDLNLKSKKH